MEHAEGVKDSGLESQCEKSKRMRGLIKALFYLI